MSNIDHRKYAIKLEARGLVLKQKYGILDAYKNIKK
jgi:hypothetical protein